VEDFHIYSPQIPKGDAVNTDRHGW
jgi:hypothetical protein